MLCLLYDDAVARLENAYVKPVNEIFARHRLNTCKQNPDKSLEDFLERLKSLSNNCNFTDRTAAQIRETAIRDAFISGMQSGFIRQRFLEDNVLALNDVFGKARRLNEARKNASLYDLAQNPRSSDYTAASCFSQETQDEELCQAAVCASSCRSSNRTNSASSSQSPCFFCGGSSHKPAHCPARQMNCYKCGRKGHFAKKCRSRSREFLRSTMAAVDDFKDASTQLAPLAPTSGVMEEKVNLYILVNRALANCLLDTGAKNNHISKNFCQQANIVVSDKNKFQVDHSGGKRCCCGNPRILFSNCRTARSQVFGCQFFGNE